MTATTQEIQTTEEDVKLLANMQTLVNKAKILREHERQLPAMISSCENEDDKVLMRVALIDCQQELETIEDLLKVPVI